MACSGITPHISEESRLMRTFRDSETMKNAHPNADSQLEPVCMCPFPRYARAFTESAHEPKVRQILQKMTLFL